MTAKNARIQVQWASGLSLLAAIWLLVSAVTVVSDTPVAANNMIVGTAVGLLAALHLVAMHTQSWPSWGSVALGIWTAVSPWVLYRSQDPASITAVNNGLTGAVIMLLGCWSAALSTPEPTATPLNRPMARPSFGGY